MDTYGTLNSWSQTPITNNSYSQISQSLRSRTRPSVELGLAADEPTGEDRKSACACDVLVCAEDFQSDMLETPNVMSDFSWLGHLGCFFVYLTGVRATASVATGHGRAPRMKWKHGKAVKQTWMDSMKECWSNSCTNQIAISFSIFNDSMTKRKSHRCTNYVLRSF